MVNADRPRRPAHVLTLAVTTMAVVLCIGVLLSQRTAGPGWACATAACRTDASATRLPDATDVMQDWVAARSL